MVRQRSMLPDVKLYFTQFNGRRLTFVVLLSLIHFLNIPLSIYWVPGIVLGAKSRKTSKVRSLPMKKSFVEIYAVQPIPQFPLPAVWVSPKAKTYLVLHGVMRCYSLARCVFACSRVSSVQEGVISRLRQVPLSLTIISRMVPLPGWSTNQLRWHHLRAS